jgi:hypothetical protein
VGSFIQIVPFWINPSRRSPEMNLSGTAMRHKAIHELFDYWNALRGRRAAPERAELDLAAIRGLIADMFMLEVDAAHQFPFVLSGTRVNALACTELMGRSFLDFWPAHEARSIAAMLLTVMDASRPMIATATAAPTGCLEQEIEILFLPLGRHRQDRARILGLAAPASQPSWLGLRPIENLKLQSLYMIDDAMMAREFDVRTLFRTALASAQGRQTEGSRQNENRQRNVKQGVRTARNVGHLRVFEGGRKFS